MSDYSPEQQQALLDRYWASTDPIEQAAIFQELQRALAPKRKPEPEYVQAGIDVVVEHLKSGATTVAQRKSLFNALGIAMTQEAYRYIR